MLHTIRWQIEVEADTTLEACKEALRIQRDPNSTATVFEVILGGADRVVEQHDLEGFDPDVYDPPLPPKNILHMHLSRFLKQLDKDNGYNEDTEHDEMYEDHEALMIKAVELLNDVDKYKTLSEIVAEQEKDRVIMKEQLDAYLKKYLTRDTDTATLVGELL